MDTHLVHNALQDALSGRRLLEHPFYKRWEAGELAAPELAAYAEQYRHVEAALPVALERVAKSLCDSEARRLVEENLADELGRPAPHLALFDQFARAVGAQEGVAVSQATAALVNTYATNAAIEGIAVIAAYEVQAAEIAGSKADGLRRHYGVDASGTTFWDVHRDLEADHATWSEDALAHLGASYQDVFVPARASADAWWAFLDEREAAASLA